MGQVVQTQVIKQLSDLNRSELAADMALKGTHWLNSPIELRETSLATTSRSCSCEMVCGTHSVSKGAPADWASVVDHTSVDWVCDPMCWKRRPHLVHHKLPPSLVLLITIAQPTAELLSLSPPQLKDHFPPPRHPGALVLPPESNSQQRSIDSLQSILKLFIDEQGLPAPPPPTPSFEEVLCATDPLVIQHSPQRQEQSGCSQAANVPSGQEPRTTPPPPSRLPRLPRPPVCSPPASKCTAAAT